MRIYRVTVLPEGGDMITAIEKNILMTEPQLIEAMKRGIVLRAEIEGELNWGDV